MIYYIISLITSLFSLIKSILIMFPEEEEVVSVQFYGNEELYISLVISIIMIIIGMATDRKRGIE